MANLRTRIDRLSERIGPNVRPDDCPGGITALAIAGEPRPADPMLCRLCGQPHWLVIVQEVVDPCT